MNIGRLRLTQQRIAGARCAQPADVVRWMGAMQAQEFHQAMWAVALRTRDATLPDVEQAIRDRQIVWTWPMRGTLHLVAAADVRWLLNLLAPRRIAAMRTRRQQLELDESQLARCEQLSWDALSAGNCLTRTALLQVFEGAGLSTAGQRGYYILWHLAHQGVICLGPLAGHEQTVVLLDEWVPAADPIPRAVALARLANVYFRSHGPATVQDFAGWAGITLTDARAGLAVTQKDLIAVSQDGQEYWLAAYAAEPPADDALDVSLLPGFDEYILGYKDRNAVLASDYFNRIVPGGNGIFLPMLVIDGQIVGTWKRTVKRAGIEMILVPFADLTIPHERIERVAQRYCTFLGKPLAQLTITAG